MKLIIKYNVGDGYTWNAEIVLPVEYESKEQLELDFLEFFEKFLQQKKDHKTWSIANNAISSRLNYRFKTSQEEKAHNKATAELLEYREGEPKVSDYIDFLSGQEALESYDFVEGDTYYPPEIMTIDEWFQKEGYKNNE